MHQARLFVVAIGTIVLLWAPKATQSAPLMATQTAPPGRGDLMH